MEFKPLGVLPLEEAKKLQDQLMNKGVQIKLEHNEATCTRGCKVTVEFLGRLDDIDVIRDTYSDNIKESLKGHDVDWEQIASVFNPNEENAVCPACGCKFSTKKSKCPDCALVLG